MPAKLRINQEYREAIADAVEANINACYTCGTCITGCPVYAAAGRLEPLKLVYMAKLGLMDELVRLPEIWYCLTCNRCNHLCPMQVKPASLVDYLRQEAFRHQVVPQESLKPYQELRSLFSRILWQAVLRCQNREGVADILDNWNQWLQTPVEAFEKPVVFSELPYNSESFRKTAEKYTTFPTNLTACLTCTECSVHCPMFHERTVFDPLWIFRMTNLGLQEDLLKSPSIWLCLDCQTCTRVCGQEIKGHLIIRHLQEQAVAKGFVDQDFPNRWQEMRKSLFARYLQEIDNLMGFSER